MLKDKLIYVCSPYGGMNENYEAAKAFGRYVLNQGFIPVIPHTMLHGVADDKNPEHRRAALGIGKKLLDLCNEVWVFGERDSATEGMEGEIIFAGNIGKPVKYISPSVVMNNDERTTAIRKCIFEYEKRYLSIGRITSDQIVEFIDSGLSSELITEAIDKAYRKGAAWRYAQVILTACRRKGIKTLEAYRDSLNKKKKPDDFAGFDLETFERKLNSD